jgi:hypothetical protein
LPVNCFPAHILGIPNNPFIDQVWIAISLLINGKQIFDPGQDQRGLFILKQISQSPVQLLKILPDHSGVIIGPDPVAELGGNALVPDQETRLRANDTLTLVGPDAEVDEAVRCLARNGRKWFST